MIEIPPWKGPPRVFFYLFSFCLPFSISLSSISLWGKICSVFFCLILTQCGLPDSLPVCGPRLDIEAENYPTWFAVLLGLPFPKTVQQNPTAAHGNRASISGPPRPPSQPSVSEMGRKAPEKHRTSQVYGHLGWQGWGGSGGTSTLHKPVSSGKWLDCSWRSDSLAKFGALCFPVFQQTAHLEGPFILMASVCFLAQICQICFLYQLFSKHYLSFL